MYYMKRFTPGLVGRLNRYMGERGRRDMQRKRA